MKNKIKLLWSPWRMEYVKREKEKGCVFCNRIKQSDDKKNLILVRFKYSFVIMNLYPYNNGHLMVVPYRHVSDYSSLKEIERNEIAELTNLSIKVMKNVLNPQGFNIGMNIGRIGGAGIADHLHQHIVPRWEGDTNFMPIIGHTKVIVDSLNETYNDLKIGFSKLS
jgi:ATP adenylyltransferase